MDLYFRSAASPVNVANIFGSNLKTTSSSCPAALCISNWPSSCGAGECTLRGNIFNYSAPDGQYHLIINENTDDVPSIDASLSYWGTSDESNLTRSMFDGRDDVAITTINYLPYLMSNDPNGEKRLVSLVRLKNMTHLIYYLSLWIKINHQFKHVIAGILTLR